MKYTKTPTTPQRTVVDLDGGQTVTADKQLLFDFETDRVPLQNRPVTAAGEHPLPGNESFPCVRTQYYFLLMK